MSNITSLGASGSGHPQVIALDSRKPEQVVSDKQYLKILQLSDLLSRHLNLADILKVFSHEIQPLVPHGSYRYVSESLGEPIREGDIDRHSLQYRLTIQQMDLGELTLYRDQPFGSNEVCQFEDLLCSLVYPLRNGLLYHTAITSAYRDPLTDINNRAALEKLLPREINLAKRHDHRLAMMILDLDGFKRINDEHGHDVGDRVLIRVAELIKSCLRDTDLLFRYGGDEFVAALPHTDIQGGIDVAHRVLEQVMALDMDDLGVTGRLGMSAGLTMLQAGDNFTRFFKRADEALYRAKKSGKHQVVIG